MAIKPKPKPKAPVKPKHKLYHITDSVILNLARNTLTLRAFPFLKSILNLNKGAGCKRCNKENKRYERIMNSARQAFVNLSGGKKMQLKNILNAQQLRVAIKQGTKTTTHTF
jgi:hypothetical protein